MIDKQSVTPAEAYDLIVERLEMISNVMERENGWLQEKLNYYEECASKDDDGNIEYHNLGLAPDEVETHMRNIAKVVDFSEWAASILKSFKVVSAQ